jgi:hypothetical protein
MLAGALAPGLIAADRPFQTSLCDLEYAPVGCAPRADFDYAGRPFVHAKRELTRLGADGARTYASQLKNSYRTAGGSEWRHDESKT